jgi:hypothetical protein
VSVQHCVDSTARVTSQPPGISTDAVPLVQLEPELTGFKIIIMTDTGLGPHSGLTSS